VQWEAGMIEWLIAVAVFALLMLGMIAAIRSGKLKPGKGGGGFAFALAMIFASVFDPAKAAAIEQLDRQKETEGNEDGESGAGPE
jgi:hypothetical protein